MTIDRTYPFFAIRWLAIRGLAVATVFFFLVHPTINLIPNYRAITQSKPKE
ncbi:hypothetical protein ACP275_14G079100 [Erythranthe tilingii]